MQELVIKRYRQLGFSDSDYDGSPKCVPPGYDSWSDYLCKREVWAKEEVIKIQGEGGEAWWEEKFGEVERWMIEELERTNKLAEESPCDKDWVLLKRPALKPREYRR